eukprot:5108022-Prymnesium_polylepis.1
MSIYNNKLFAQPWSGALVECGLQPCSPVLGRGSGQGAFHPRGHMPTRNRQYVCALAKRALTTSIRKGGALRERSRGREVQRILTIVAAHESSPMHLSSHLRPSPLALDSSLRAFKVFDQPLVDDVMCRLPR